VLAFDTRQNDLAYNDVEAMRKFESKGEVVHLEAGQKEHLKLKLITGGDVQ
jgi:cell envelope opacity-associated protein A